MTVLRALGLVLTLLPTVVFAADLTPQEGNEALSIMLQQSTSREVQLQVLVVHLQNELRTEMAKTAALQAQIDAMRKDQVPKP